MKVSIITSVYNNKEFIKDCIESIINQTYDNIEHIIIDGDSSDGTVEIIREYESIYKEKKKEFRWISEKDSGIYDAMNKGIKLAAGDIIAFLNSDDIYADNKVIERIVSIFEKEKVDACYGDLLYVSKDMNKVIRYWKAGKFKKSLFRKGWMVPHPTLFLKKELFDKYGLFNTDFKISADYELMIRFFEKNSISLFYLQKIIVKMRVGGVSNRGISNLIKKSYEDYKAWKVNNLKINPLIIIIKPLSKLTQLIKLKK